MWLNQFNMVESKLKLYIFDINIATISYNIGGSTAVRWWFWRVIIVEVEASALCSFSVQLALLHVAAFV